MEATVCCALVLSKELMVLGTPREQQLLGPGRHCCHPVETGTRDGSRDTGPRVAAGDHLQWLWASATQHFQSQVTLPWSLCLQEQGGSCAPAAPNSPCQPFSAHIQQDCSPGHTEQECFLSRVSLKVLRTEITASVLISLFIL